MLMHPWGGLWAVALRYECMRLERAKEIGRARARHAIASARLEALRQTARAEMPDHLPPEQGGNG